LAGDVVFFCSSCGYAINEQFAKEKGVKDICPKCKKKLDKTNAIEAGQVFSLGTKYSESMGAAFVDRDGKEKPLVMGCYGIGLGRLMAAIVEVYHDEKGIIWPKQVAPFEAHLIAISDQQTVNSKAEEIYQKLTQKGVEVLYDDRQESPGVKLADADLIGIPTRLVVSEKTLKENSVEEKKRDSDKVTLVPINKL